LRKVVLKFTSRLQMAEFIIKHEVSNVISNSVDKTIDGVMTEGLINIAITQYGGKLIEGN
jgi:hypothetical protein